MGLVRVQFFGVRGSCPCPSPATVRYGGNTALARVHADPAVPILFDLGTGVIPYAATAPGVLHHHALVSHLHFDHVQGLPFFPLVQSTPASRLDVYAPRQVSGSLHDAMAGLVRPPYFPLALEEFRGDLSFHEVENDEFPLGQAKVTVRPVPHRGPAVGYRVEHGGRSVVYVSDHQAPLDLVTVPDPVLELCAGADLLIHDAQYREDEFARKANWGHSTVAYAVLVARTAGAKRLCLFHHDPSHDDDEIDRLLAGARDVAAGAVDVVAASEGLDLAV